MKYLLALVPALAPALALTLSLGLTATPALAQSDDCYPGLGLCEDAVTAKTPLPSRINIGTPEAPPSPLPQTSEQTQPQPTPAAQVCVVYDVRPPDAWLALRTEPTTKRGRRLYKLPSGTRLEMLGAQEGNWHLVRVSNGSVGWVSWYRDRWIAC